MKLKNILSFLTKSTLLLAIIGSSNLSATAHTEETETLTQYSINEKNNWSAGVQVSTIGIGIIAELPLSDRLAVRGGINTLSFTIDRDLSDTNYELDISSFSTGLFLDLHPFKGNFRMSAGGYFHSTDIDGTADLKNGIRLGGRHYDNTEVSVVTANLNYPSVLPYVGFGWGANWGHSKEWGVTFDLGVAVISSPDLTLDATGAVTSDSQFRSVLENERQDAEDDISDIPLYPVIALGLSYRF